MTGHSKNFLKYKSYYEQGLWTLQRLYDVVGKKTGITAEEFELITGMSYAGE